MIDLHAHCQASTFVRWRQYVVGCRRDTRLIHMIHMCTSSWAVIHKGSIVCWSRCTGFFNALPGFNIDPTCYFVNETPGISSCIDLLKHLHRPSEPILTVLFIMWYIKFPERFVSVWQCLQIIFFLCVCVCNIATKNKCNS